MKKKIIFALLGLFILNTTFAQIFEPVKWTFELKNTGKTTAEVIVKAKIDAGWHLYGLDIPDNGPRPTTITFESIQNAKKVGKLVGLSKLKEVYDPNFDMKLTWYAGEAVFVQKLSSEDASKIRVKGSVEFMVCNDESCLPPTTESFDLGSKAVADKMETAAVEAAPETPVAVVNDSNELVVSAQNKIVDFWTPVIGELKSFGSADLS